jgi:hypothetical protein
MAHFAELDENNIVLNLHVVNNNAIGNSEFPDSEEAGIEFLQRIFGEDKIFKQYSYNTRKNVHYGDDGQPDGKPAFRKNIAKIGGLYDESRDAFVEKQPFPSWTFSETTYTWEPPVEQPPCEEDDGAVLCYGWNEEQQTWVKLALGNTAFTNLIGGSAGPVWPTGSMHISVV